jgi:hypothetical protein
VVAPPLPAKVVPLLFEADVVPLDTLDAVCALADALLLTVALLPDVVLLLPDEVTPVVDILPMVTVLDTVLDPVGPAASVSEQALKHVAHATPNGSICSSEGARRWPCTAPLNPPRADSRATLLGPVAVEPWPSLTGARREW